MAGRTVLALVRSRVFLALCLGAAWLCFYGVLTSSDNQVNAEIRVAESNPESPEIAEGTADAQEDETDAMERVHDVFNFPVLRLSSLEKILREEGIGLAYPPSLDDVTFDALEYGGSPLAEILTELLEPRDFGFFRQGNRVCVVEMDIERQTTLDATTHVKYQSSKIRTTLRGNVGEPLDVWVEASPLVRLRITAQPLYGESEQEDWVGIEVEARREGRLWFYENARARLGGEAQFHASSNESVWLMLRPIDLKDSQISFEVQFQHDTTMPSS
ncbi:hypothetical protein JW916_16360 [Candidatus Sumerlaeota bacterium]|nr:hypothetical protein [Candidatus Sumerlaeota bacterium]